MGKLGKPPTGNPSFDTAIKNYDPTNTQHGSYFSSVGQILGKDPGSIADQYGFDKGYTATAYENKGANKQLVDELHQNYLTKTAPLQQKNATDLAYAKSIGSGRATGAPAGFTPSTTPMAPAGAPARPATMSAAPGFAGVTSAGPMTATGKPGMGPAMQASAAMGAGASAGIAQEDPFSLGAPGKQRSGFGGVRRR